MIQKRTINILGDPKILNSIFDVVTADISAFEKKHSQNVGGRITLVLDVNSTAYSQALSMAEKYRLNPTIFQSVYYTKAETEKSEYFQMRIQSPLEREGTEASDYGTQYEGGCQNPTCKLGKHLVGDVYVDRKLIKKLNIGNLRPDIYVSEQIKNLVCENELTGVSFKNKVKDFKDRAMPEFHVMEIGSILPPMALGTWLIQDEKTNHWYRECGHQVLYLRSDIQYEKEKLEKSLDFNVSVEYINNYRLKEIIVSSKVREIFKQHKVHAGFFPVTVL